MATMFNVRFMAFATALVMIGILICTDEVASSYPTATTAAEDDTCNGDLDVFVADCASFIKDGSTEKTPSTACCSVIKKMDLKCACTHLTKEVESTMNMERLVGGFASCGRPLSHGYKCGSDIVP